MTLSKSYEWKQYEDEMYARWEASGFFNPDNLPGERVETYSIVLPPPNATGTLHLGHAMYVVQDIMIRYARMQGKKTLWLPGTDHAAIATQSKVESLIFAAEGKTRHDLGRAELITRVEKYVEDSKSTIRNQLRKMGFSLDWSRERFTLEPLMIAAVQKMFIMMAQDGLVYRGDRIVNWDPKLQTTVADDEQEYKEERAPFYYFKYGPFTIGTSRPETKFGDKYVVVHPNDERYAKFEHGQRIELEWINGPVTATVIKDAAADPAIGTGAMTITPWHDAVDFAIAERHHLDRAQIIDLDGKLLPIGGEFIGMPIAEARPKIVERLKQKGLLVKIDEKYVHNIAVNYRGGGMIEPQIMKQWFVAVDKPVVEWKGRQRSLKEIAIAVVKSGDIKIVPDRFNKIYFHWMENLHDWCISRQLWYGHRIPAWYAKDDLEGMKPVVQVESPGAEYRQEEDVLDTWFSSGMWTFSTLDWLRDFDFERRQAKPETDLARFHPTTVMETGYDILFFWVARMIIMTTYGMGEIPFKTVYLHGLVRDRAGQKMSKSKGNGIDPLTMSEKYGTDAVRLSLVIGTSPGSDQRLYEEKIAGYRNFVNKIWNASRYVLMQSGTAADVSAEGSNDAAACAANALADRWIVSRLNNLIAEVTADLDTYQYGAAAEKAYDFLWSEFADWYLEITKFQPNPALTRHVLETVLTLLHPYVPYVTEAIWKELGHQNLLMITQWPKADPRLWNAEMELEFSYAQDIVTQLRNLRSQYTISYKKSFTVHTKNVPAAEQKSIIEKLARVVIEQSDSTGATTELANAKYNFTISLGDLIDVAAEKQRLQKEISQLQQYVASLEKKLANQQYTSNAPAEVIERDKHNLADTTKELATLQDTLTKL